MKKALIYASVASMIDQFNRNNIKILLDLGYKVEIAANFEKGNSISKERINMLKKDLDRIGVPWHHIPVPRNLSSLTELISAYVQSEELLNENQYDLIHFHSPIGAAIGRFAARKSRKTGTKIYYTAHGFHFYKGASIFNWMTYYPVEFLLSNMTDYLITINEEDYKRGQTFNTKNVIRIPGIGIDTEKLDRITIDIKEKRMRLGVKADELFILSTGELNENKNHRMVLSALAKINKPFKYLICGQGSELKNLQLQAKKLNISDKVIFLGYREDIHEILKAADIYCFPSIREGLSVSLMEAMAAGLPCIVSQIRGNIDLVDENGGYLFELDRPTELENGLRQLMDSEINRKTKGTYNHEKIKSFDTKIVDENMEHIYKMSLKKW